MFGLILMIHVHWLTKPKSRACLYNTGCTYSPFRAVSSVSLLANCTLAY